MPNVSLPDTLFFQGSTGGGTITPTSTFTDADFGGASVVDANNDGNMDAVDNYVFGTAFYTGFTIEINGNNYEVAFQTGKLYLEKGNFKDSRPYLERAVKLDPKSSQAFRYLGDCYVAVSGLPEPRKVRIFL